MKDWRYTVIDWQTTLLRDTREMWLLSASVHMCVFLYACLHAFLFRSSMRTNICVCYSPLEVLILCHLAARGDAAHHLPHLMTVLPPCPPLYAPPHLHLPHFLCTLCLFSILSNLHLRAFLPSQSLCAAQHTHRVRNLLLATPSDGDGIEKMYRP